MSYYSHPPGGAQSGHPSAAHAVHPRVHNPQLWQTALESEWMAFLKIANPTASKEDILEYYVRQHGGDIQAAGDSVIAFLQACGALRTHNQAPAPALPNCISGIIGRQPRSPAECLFLNIDNQYQLRLWTGDLGELHSFSLGFCDLSGRPVNTPNGYELWEKDQPNSDFEYTQLRSLEYAFGYEDPNTYRAGTETYMISEGARVHVRRFGHEVVAHVIPARPKNAARN
ncbi:unnamed protein product [Cyclocybe aegerita]|uniref:Uncharacterized protein n=1 Tax=Cyclocybe aegerita TaxID=1973307 RepID=A0A8S0Y0N1_CYCAE|nr:unnamed protein product [Cyclocybe aegerita]